MKYYYQYVSPKSVRIELITEDKKESEQFHEFDTSGAYDQELKSLYSAALLPYAANSTITKINFMEFPKVAPVSFDKAVIE
ncbi:hypothetical protein EZ449_15495 [Pedobacter frigidisoli]|uniref:Uncharacterized protein n=1 Tax=Pedobacter frigidisoli TaxID=2530455 RepID=A0A4R0NWP9_9SPHI|nr:hypothetical protein [Pedobacter frigidisoli]TCD05866.1 hypothetical protein EZ449_15495 [Pedobacter frigidisoli]